MLRLPICQQVGTLPISLGEGPALVFDNLPEDPVAALTEIIEQTVDALYNHQPHQLPIGGFLDQIERAWVFARYRSVILHQSF